jgi:hypothetical protein
MSLEKIIFFAKAGSSCSLLLIILPARSEVWEVSFGSSNCPYITAMSSITSPQTLHLILRQNERHEGVYVAGLRVWDILRKHYQTYNEFTNKSRRLNSEDIFSEYSHNRLWPSFRFKHYDFHDFNQFLQPDSGWVLPPSKFLSSHHSQLYFLLLLCYIIYAIWTVLWSQWIITLYYIYIWNAFAK